jgi:hypothetical protein
MGRHKPLYRARMTTKKGAYRVREFASEKNAIRWATRMVNEGATGYIERENTNGSTYRNHQPVWHSDQLVEVA